MLHYDHSSNSYIPSQPFPTYPTIHSDKAESCMTLNYYIDMASHEEDLRYGKLMRMDELWEFSGNCGIANN